MPIQIQNIHDQDDIVDCPLCMETLEVDDINFFPCECGYQICRFCWHRIRTDGNGLCPACRKPYPENPAEFKPLTDQELQKIRQDKKQKEVARKQKITDSRKHLANVRVLQKNLVFVVGLSQRLADIEILKRPEYFGKYGKILKVVLNSNTSYAGSQSPSCSAYVTYSKMEESLRAIQSVNNVYIDGKTLKASLGTTKYCSNYLKNQVCQKHDCMYLHEIGDEDASFTKEDMQMAKHQEYEQKLIQQMIQKEIQQEIRAKAMRQDGTGENGGGSEGSSPPSSTITSGLSVAQAVKKNTKPAGEMSSSSDHRCLNTGTLLETPDTQEDNAHNKNIAKGPNISSGEKEGGGAKEANGSKSSSRRTTTGKKQSTTAAQSQAPRHKKQHSSDSKKITPESANDKAVASSALSASVESLPPLPSTPSSSSSSNAFSAEPQQDTKLSEDRLSLMRTSALPIDIPASSEDLDRRTPLSDCSSSIGQKSYVQDGFVHESSAASNTNSVDTSCSSLAKPKFMMMHKEYTEGTSAANVSNGLGFSPFGMNPTAPNILQDICSQDNIMTNTQPVSRVMPAPPGLSSVVTMHSGNWPAPNSRLCDSMPIQSSHDWEAAFGFKSSANETGVSSVDDELGFDPWLECSKGFADLMKEEKHTKTTSDTNLGNTVPQSSMAFQNLLAQTSRPSFVQDRNLPKSSQAGLSDLVNGFSNLFTNPAQIYPQQRMPFSSEQSRFLPQQRLVPDMHASLGQNQQNRQFGNAGMHLPPSKDPQLLKGDGNIQEIQNEFRALLPSVNINFTHQNHAQRSATQNLDLSLGLSNLGMPMGGAPHKQPISQPPGIGSLPIQNNPFMNKQHVMSPTGFNNRHSQIRHAWGGLDSAFSNQGMSSNRIPGPAGMHSLFPGVRSEPEVASPSYPPDPAIIQGQGFNPTMRRNRLFENSFAGPGMGNQNNNGSDEQPHWMKSLQSMMDHDSPTSPQPASSHSQGFPQQRTNNNMPSWPNMSNLFPSNSAGFNNSQPPPGFQVRPTLSKPTEFGAFQNLLENQS